MKFQHSFRLRDPWQCAPCGEDRVEWSRGFNCPTGLEPGDQLWLVVAGLPARAAVAVNDAAVELADGAACIHPHVRFGGNRVTLRLRGIPPADGLFPYEVQLGIVAS